MARKGQANWFEERAKLEKARGERDWWQDYALRLEGAIRAHRESIVGDDWGGDDVLWSLVPKGERHAA